MCEYIDAGGWGGAPVRARPRAQGAGAFIAIVENCTVTHGAHSRCS
jgi:hypothetical protein